MLHLLDPIEISNIIKHESTKNELKTKMIKSGSSITGMYIKEKKLPLSEAKHNYIQNMDD
jgi:hypothetical protein